MTEKKPSRRTLSFIQKYPTPAELYEKVTTSEGWEYKTNEDFYHTRDRALVSMLYVLALRVSEALRLVNSQNEREKTKITVNSIKLSKSYKKAKARRHQYREEGWIALTGERAGFGKLITEYLDLLEPNAQLFPFGRKRAYQIVEAITGEPPHWLRAYGEKYLYRKWNRDPIAVNDYVKVDLNVLMFYIRESYQDYKAV